MTDTTSQQRSISPTPLSTTYSSNQNAISALSSNYVSSTIKSQTITTPNQQSNSEITSQISSSTLTSMSSGILSSASSIVSATSVGINTSPLQQNISSSAIISIGATSALTTLSITLMNATLTSSTGIAYTSATPTSTSTAASFNSASANYYIVYYYVTLCNSTVFGPTVINALNKLSPSAASTLLGGIIKQTGLESSLNDTATTAPIDRKLWLIGAIIGPVAFVVILILALYYLHTKCRTRTGVKNKGDVIQAIANEPLSSRYAIDDSNYRSINQQSQEQSPPRLLEPQNNNPLDSRQRSHDLPATNAQSSQLQSSSPPQSEQISQFPVSSNIPLRVTNSIQTKNDAGQLRNQ
ncbi:unnamed protein product, partial [Didymodactylos carnosus]